MKIDISSILKVDGAVLDVDFKEKLDADLINFEGFRFEEPVEFKGILTNIRGIITLKGNLNTSFITNCYNCLKEVSGEINLDISEQFVSSPEECRDNDCYTYEGNYLELDELIKDNVLLNLPMKQLCSDDCKGICPRCGANLNEKACSCSNEDFNPRFEKLADIFKNMNEN